jgi:hypothetical protein
MFTSAARLEKKIGAERLVQYCDDNRDGVADADTVEQVVLAADREVRATLRQKGWPEDKLSGLELDDFVCSLADTIAADRAAGRRAEFKLPDGTTLYSAEAKIARADLTRIATTELRPDETEAGRHAGTRSRAISPQPKHVVTDPNGTPHGGF